MIDKSQEKRSNEQNNINDYHSVEFFIKGLEIPYQFRLWNDPTASMSILIKQDSHVLPLIKVGDTLDTKYYSSKSVYPSENIRTVISHIKKKHKGRLKGHCLVGLKILDV